MTYRSPWGVGIPDIFFRADLRLTVLSSLMNWGDSAVQCFASKERRLLDTPRITTVYA